MYLPRQFPDPRRQARAFTLLEMLAVVAIIGFLAALLVPAYRGTVARAKESKCAANLRQIGLAVTAYAGEHNGAFPRGGWGGTGALPLDPPGTDGVGWLTDIFPYVDNNRNIFVCPSGKSQSPTGQDSWMRMPDGTWSDPLYPMHYAYNAQLNTNRAELRSPTDGAPTSKSVDRIAAVRNLGGLPVMIDIAFQSNFYGYGGMFSTNPSPTANQRFADRHSQKGNILWGDGHITAVTNAEWAAMPAKRVPNGGGWKNYQFCKGDY